MNDSSDVGGLWYFWQPGQTWFPRAGVISVSNRRAFHRHCEMTTRVVNLYDTKLWEKWFCVVHRLYKSIDKILELSIILHACTIYIYIITILLISWYDYLYRYVWIYLSLYLYVDPYITLSPYLTIYSYLYINSHSLFLFFFMPND